MKFRLHRGEEGGPPRRAHVPRSGRLEQPAIAPGRSVQRQREYRPTSAWRSRSSPHTSAAAPPHGPPRSARGTGGAGRACGARERIERLHARKGHPCAKKAALRRTTDSNHPNPVANVPARRFELAAPNAVWVTNVTYVWSNDGWLYLAVMLDLFARKSRRVGHSGSTRRTSRSPPSTLLSSRDARPRDSCTTPIATAPYANAEYRHSQEQGYHREREPHGRLLGHLRRGELSRDHQSRAHRRPELHHPSGRLSDAIDARRSEFKQKLTLPPIVSIRRREFYRCGTLRQNNPWRADCPHPSYLRNGLCSNHCKTLLA